MNPLTRATRGRIRVGSRNNVLILATGGVLYFVGTAIIVEESTPETLFPGYTVLLNRKIEEEEPLFLEREALLLQEDEELMLIIKIFIKCQE